MSCSIKSIIIFCLLFLTFGAQAQRNNKNPFEPLLSKRSFESAEEFLNLALKSQQELLAELPEYNKQLNGIQSYKLNIEFRRAQYFYHYAILKFININTNTFIKLNPTPDQVHRVLERVTVEPPANFFVERALFFSEALHIQRKLLNHFLPLAGKWQAVEKLLNYKPSYIHLLMSKTNIIEQNLGHLTRIGLMDNLHSFNSNTDKPYFFDTISYLKHFFHYPHLSPQQKAKKMISILLNTSEDLTLEFFNHKKELFRKGLVSNIDYLDETDILQYKNITMHNEFLESQLLRVLRNFLNQNLLMLSLNQYDIERLQNLAKAYGYQVQSYKGHLVGIGYRPGFFKGLMQSLTKQQPVIGQVKMCYLLFN